MHRLPSNYLAEQAVIDVLPLSVCILPVNRIAIGNCFIASVLQSEMLDVCLPPLDHLTCLAFLCMIGIRNFADGWCFGFKCKSA